MIQLIWLIFFENQLSFRGKMDYLDYYFLRFMVEMMVEAIIVVCLID